jgi:ribonuclease E/ribonuclease G
MITLYYDQFEGVSRAIVTRDGQVLECFFESALNPPVTGAVYNAAVDRLTHNSRNAFVRLDNGNGFLNDAEGLSQGQPILVQAKSEPRGDKGPGLTRNIALAGAYLVHNPFGNEVYFSRRLEETQKDATHVNAVLDDAPGGWVVRKSSLSAQPDMLRQEAEELGAYGSKLLQGADRQGLLLPGASAFEQALLMAAGEGAVNVVIEQGTNLNAVTQNLKALRPSLIANLKITEIKHALDENDLENFYGALSQHTVPLGRGGNVMFEHTDTLNIIDVNGGERFHALEVNRDAVQLIMQQIRFRNIGGLIVIDFLKMKNREDRDAVADIVHDIAAADPHAMEVYGFTRMGLFEISRARRGFSLDELLEAVE